MAITVSAVVTMRRRRRRRSRSLQVMSPSFQNDRGVDGGVARRQRDDPFRSNSRHDAVASRRLREIRTDGECLCCRAPSLLRAAGITELGFDRDLGCARPDSSALAIDELLLVAKTSVPQLRPGLVARGGLIEAARTSDCRVVGVTAPAGYGKSTLLAQWALAEQRRVAWASLDRFDDDPAALLMLLAAAYTRVTPGHADLVSDVSGPGVSVLGRAAPRLASALRTSTEPFVLMLDDLHEVQSPDCHDALGVVMAGVPRGSQLVAASRSEQPHLPRLRASGDVVEFGASHLALDTAGAEQIFADAEVSVTPELAAALTERTEGWPVGLYLSALIAQRRRW